VSYPSTIDDTFNTLSHVISYKLASSKAVLKLKNMNKVIKLFGLTLLTLWTLKTSIAMSLSCLYNECPSCSDYQDPTCASNGITYPNPCWVNCYNERPECSPSKIKHNRALYYGKLLDFKLFFLRLSSKYSTERLVPYDNSTSANDTSATNTNRDPLDSSSNLQYYGLHLSFCIQSYLW